MKGLYFVLAGLLVLAVVLAGCVGKKAEPVTPPVVSPPPEQPPEQPPAVEGDITPPEESGVQIEIPQSSADENVDLGSLI